MRDSSRGLVHCVTLCTSCINKECVVCFMGRKRQSKNPRVSLSVRGCNGEHVDCGGLGLWCGLFVVSVDKSVVMARD